MSTIDLDAIEALADSTWVVSTHEAPLELVGETRALVARVRELEAVVERVKALRPTWYRGMYGSPDDMISAVDIECAINGDRA